MSSKNQKSNRVPDGWLGCPNNGKKLIVNRIMPLKTPLSKNFDSKLPVEDRFHPDDIFKLAERNKVRFGLWIDLTNTDRYYDKEEIRDLNCRYIKFSMQGHGSCPTGRDIKTFLQIVDQFVERNNEDCIAIHCTHGFNRTGFLIVALLVERYGFNVVDAIKDFADLRPPGIYRHNYIKELYRRYGSEDAIPELPEQPPWSNR